MERLGDGADQAEGEHRHRRHAEELGGLGADAADRVVLRLQQDQQHEQQRAAEDDRRTEDDQDRLVDDLRHREGHHFACRDTIHRICVQCSFFNIFSRTNCNSM